MSQRTDWWPIPLVAAAIRSFFIYFFGQNIGGTLRFSPKFFPQKQKNARTASPKGKIAVGKVFVTACGLSVLVACERDLTLVLPEHVPQTVLMAFLQNGQPLEVTVSKTRGVLSEAPFEYPHDAILLRYADGQLLDTLVFGYNTLGQPRYFTDEPPLPNVSYTLRAQVPGLPEATATAVMPEAVSASLDAWDTLRTNAVNFGDERYLATVRMAIADAPNVDNYYILRVGQVLQNYYVVSPGDTFFYPTDTTWLIPSSTRPGALPEYPGGGMLFSEAAIENGIFSATCFMRLRGNNIMAKGFVVDFRHVSYAHYLFQRSIYQSNLSSDLSFFGEPVEVFNNVTGGFGNFSSMQQMVFWVPW